MEAPILREASGGELTGRATPSQPGRRGERVTKWVNKTRANKRGNKCREARAVRGTNGRSVGEKGRCYKPCTCDAGSSSFLQGQLLVIWRRAGTR